MFFGNKGKTQRKGSNMPLSEAAFSFLQWAEYGDLPEIPDFTAAKTTPGADNSNEENESSDSDDAIILQEEDLEQAGGEAETEERPNWAESVNNAESDKSSLLPEMDDPRGFEESVVLRPYQRQALHWMMKREQQGESREELDKELQLLSELAKENQNTRNSAVSSWQGGAHTTSSDMYCDCGPVVVSKAAKLRAKSLDGQSNPVNHPLWQSRYLGNHNLEGVATLFYVNELLGIATCQPPAPPKQCSGGILADDMYVLQLSKITVKRIYSPFDSHMSLLGGLGKRSCYWL